MSEKIQTVYGMLLHHNKAVYDVTLWCIVFQNKLQQRYCESDD